MENNNEKELFNKIKDLNDRCNDLLGKIGKYDNDGRLRSLVDKLVELKIAYNVNCFLATIDRRYRQSYKILQWYADEENTGELNRYAKNFIDKTENPFEV